MRTLITSITKAAAHYTLITALRRYGPVIAFVAQDVGPAIGIIGGVKARQPLESPDD